MASEVAVLMAAYNSEATIKRAVDSLTRSTYPCDIFIVDDGSRIPVSEILAPDSNVEIIRLAKNQGLAGALNAGLKRILELPYKYVARMDADDISYRDRFAKQVAFLDRHPNIGAVSTWGRHFEEHTGETILIRRPPVKPEAVRRELFANSAMLHASAMFRADVFRAVGPYSRDYPAAEDYELFCRISKKFALDNVPEVLIDVCESRTGISRSRRQRQVYDRLKIQLKYFEPAQWRAWVGVARTLVMLVMPRSAVWAVKRIRDQFVFGQPAGSAS